MDVISNGLRYKGKEIPKGKEIKSVPNGLVARWLRMGFAKAKDGYEKQVKPPVEKAEDKKEVEFPKHTGGGWYVLSNGEKIRGEDEAIAAEKELG